MISLGNDALDGRISNLSINLRIIKPPFEHMFAYPETSPTRRRDEIFILFNLFAFETGFVGK